MPLKQFILAPRISSYPGAEAKAREVLRWLVKEEIVQPFPSRCVPYATGYAPAAGVSKVLTGPLPTQGLQIVTERCLFMPEQGFSGKARCPECRKPIGEPLLEHLEEWVAGETENFTCPECGHEDDINGFAFEQMCVFSDLGFIFHGWNGDALAPSFIEALAARVGYDLSRVHVWSLS